MLNQLYLVNPSAPPSTTINRIRNEKEKLKGTKGKKKNFTFKIETLLSLILPTLECLTQIWLQKIIIQEFVLQNLPDSHMLWCSSLGRLWTVSDHLPGEWSLLLEETWASALVSRIILSTSVISGRFSGAKVTQAIAMLSRAPSFSSEVSFPELPSPDSVSSSLTDLTHLGMSEPCSWTRSWNGVFPVSSSNRRTPKLYTSAGWVRGRLLSRHSGAL